MTALAPPLAVFLREHLPRDRRASPHTCEAYDDAVLVIDETGFLKQGKPNMITPDGLRSPALAG
jgi:hypothetical protein